MSEKYTNELIKKYMGYLGQWVKESSFELRVLGSMVALACFVILGFDALIAFIAGWIFFVIGQNESKS